MDITNIFMCTAAAAAGGGVPVMESFAIGVTETASTSHTCAAPSGIADGDLLVLFIGVGSGTASYHPVTAPSGFTLQGTIRKGNWTHLEIHTKVASSESGSYSYSTSGSNIRSTALMCRVSGASATVHKVSTQISAGNVTSYTSPAVTTTLDDCLILTVFTTAYSTAYMTAGTIPSTEVGVAETASSHASGGYLVVSEKDLATAASTGTESFSFTSSYPDKACAGTIALSPA